MVGRNSPKRDPSRFKKRPLRKRQAARRDAVVARANASADEPDHGFEFEPEQRRFIGAVTDIEDADLPFTMFDGGADEKFCVTHLRLDRTGGSTEAAVGQLLWSARGDTR